MLKDWITRKLTHSAGIRDTARDDPYPPSSKLARTGLIQSRYLLLLALGVAVWTGVSLASILIVDPYGVSPVHVAIAGVNVLKPKSVDVDRLIKTSRGSVALLLAAGFHEDQPSVTVVQYNEDGEGLLRRHWMPGQGGLADWLSDSLGIPKDEATEIADHHVALWKAMDHGADRRDLRKFTGIILGAAITLAAGTLALIAVLVWLAVR